jgi:hypothetical protein
MVSGPLDFFTGEMFTGRNMIADPFGDVQAAEAQQAAQDKALQQQLQLAHESQALFQAQSTKGQGYLDAGLSKGVGSLEQYAAQAQGQLGQAGGALGTSRDAALGAIAGGYGQARSDLGRLTGLQSYAAGATRPIGTYDVMSGSRSGQMLDNGQLGINPYNVTGQPSRLEGMLARGDALAQRLDQPTRLEDDPGYQFRRQQGEQAIMRQASAQGGRFGGRTLKALADYNQNAASQEYAAADQRRRATDQAQLGLYGQQAGMAGGVDQFGQAAQFNQAGRSDAAAQQNIQNRLGLSQYADQLATNQAGRSDAAALQAQQNQMALAGRGYDAQGQLAQLASGYGGQQAGLHTQYGQDLSGIYGQQAQLSGNLGSQLAQLYGSAGQNMANVAIGVGGNAQGLNQGLMGAYQNYAQTGGMAQQAQANQNKETAGMLMAMFSDERLKVDLEPVPGSKYERIGLSGFRWTWNAIAERLGLHGRGGGVIAQEVREKIPHVVYERDGFLTVDYAELDRLIAEAA